MAQLCKVEKLSDEHEHCIHDAKWQVSTANVNPKYPADHTPAIVCDDHLPEACIHRTSKAFNECCIVVAL